ncbi:hypothetical protein L208DRAFT_1415372 [Tricholoma matsutake]|nr:hypothetical protein L208DRAFT_1415372 [Tricholoma matsutake 945]
MDLNTFNITSAFLLDNLGDAAGAGSSVSNTSQVTNLKQTDLVGRGKASSNSSASRCQWTSGVTF